MTGQRTLPGIGLVGFWDLGSGYKTEMDANLLALTTLVQLRVKSRVTALPGSPVNGDIYIVPSGGDANKVAVRDNGAWSYYVAAEGFMAYVEDEEVYVRWTGTAWVQTGHYDVGFFVAGLMTASELVGMLVATRDFTIPVSATGSRAKSNAASTGDVSLTLKKNGSSFGTVRFNISATGSFTVASATAFAPGDILTLEAPGSADATLAGVAINLMGALL